MFVVVVIKNFLDCTNAQIKFTQEGTLADCSILSTVIDRRRRHYFFVAFCSSFLPSSSVEEGSQASKDNQIVKKMTNAMYSILNLITKEHWQKSTDFSFYIQMLVF